MFNHQARWDRDLPCQDRDRYGEPICVVCVMNKGQVIPKSFAWRNKTFDVTKIHFRWKDKQGREELIFFSVQTPCGAYEILLRSDRLSWYLVRLLGP
ncbi:MAG: hypothetical protein PHH75_06540 [Candidatus Omnitrophica bacterium]|nr:hypothetical protein [Candidatus Omnitrophota bacterium]MDD5574819.1 hypothetical protein [Candidatus Omnitrophota bacterium]